MRLREPEIDLTQAEANERLALLERVSRSPQLRRASRLRELLLYIGKQSIELGKTELREQEIGTAVFGRRPHYDTSQDNIVRVNATELRKRLESYFATDGADELCVLEIPRGGYSPVFSRRKVQVPASGKSELPQNVSELVSAPQEGPTSEKASPQFLPQTANKLRHLLAAGIIGILSVICVMLALQNRSMRLQMHGWQATPALRSFWGVSLGVAPRRMSSSRIPLSLWRRIF